MSSKPFNPSTPAFISTKSIAPSQPPSQAKQQRANPNMSSHVAPPPVQRSKSNSTPGSSNGNGGKRSGKNRESRNRRNNQSQAYQQQQHQNIDNFELDIEDEVLGGGASFKSRSRRGQISINHLLDFSLPSRDLNSNRLSYAPRRRRRSSNHHDRLHLHGAEFINANYRFVVDYRNDYVSQIANPNKVLDDSSILRVIVPRGHQCPICLTDEIVAPRMISCGHLFCHTCLLSFLDSEPLRKKDAPVKKFKECPLCSLSVRPHEIKPALINQADERFEIPKVGDDVVMKLMAKPMDSILPIPHGLNLNHKKIGNIPWYSDSELHPHSRILKGGLKFVQKCYEDDKAAIVRQYDEDKLLYNDDNTYVVKALDEINFQLDLLKGSFQGNYDEPNPLVCSMDNLSITEKNLGLDDSNCYFFYQTSFNSTTRYFLSPLDIKVLLATYGSYANFPTTLLLKVDNINYGAMVTEETLKRHKYFGHLPLGTELAFIDVNWKNIIPPEIYQMFSKELIDRRKKLLTKMKKEDKAKKTYENEQEQKTLDFFKQQNDGWGTYDNIPIQFDGSEVPLHPFGDDEIKTEPEEMKEMTTTVWGTKIPKLQTNEHEELLQDDWDTEELIRKAKESEQTNNGTKRRGRKKKLVLLSSNSSHY